MLRMVNKIIVFLSTSLVLLAGNQNVDVTLDLTFPGASQKMIGEKMVIDLGFLREGHTYSSIEIGNVNVKITQTKTAEDTEACFLENLEFNSVNTNKLEKFLEKIDSKDKIYIGTVNNSIILTAKDVKVTDMQGDVEIAKEDFLFVAPECIPEKLFPGEALTSFSYTFKLYADIVGEIKKESIVGAFAQDSKGVEISIKSLIASQIKNSNLKPYRRRK